MEMFARLFGALKVRAGRKAIEPIKTSDEYHREALIKQGGEQFQKLVDKGLRVPVALL